MAVLQVMCELRSFHVIGPVDAIRHHLPTEVLFIAMQAVFNRLMAVLISDERLIEKV